jgi:type I restriction enzyme S subunit
MYIVSQLDDMAADCYAIEQLYQKKLNALAELKQPLLQKAFSGELTAGKEAPAANLMEEEVA